MESAHNSGNKNVQVLRHSLLLFCYFSSICYTHTQTNTHIQCSSVAIRINSSFREKRWEKECPEHPLEQLRQEKVLLSQEETVSDFFVIGSVSCPDKNLWIRKQETRKQPKGRKPEKLAVFLHLNICHFFRDCRFYKKMRTNLGCYLPLFPKEKDSSRV